MASYIDSKYLKGMKVSKAIHFYVYEFNLYIFWNFYALKTLIYFISILIFTVIEIEVKS